MPNVTVVAHIRAKQGKEEETKKALLALVGPTRREAGCLNYDLHQSDDDATLFVFYENWTSKGHLAAHAASAHIQSFRARAGEILAAPPDIKTFVMVSELATGG